MANRDPDTEYFAGCMTSSAISFLILIISVGRCLLDAYGPKTIYSNDGLMQMVLQTSIPSLIITFFAVWKLGTAAFTGSLGGWACAAAYWFLHLQQSIAKAPAETGKQTEYLDSTMWFVPITLFVVGTVFAILGSLTGNRKNKRTPAPK
jgi:hypothetical protein